MGRGQFCIDLACSQNDAFQASRYDREAQDYLSLVPHLSMTCGKLFVAAAYAFCADDYDFETYLIGRIRSFDQDFHIGKLVIPLCKPHSEDPCGIERELRKETLQTLRVFLRIHPGFSFEDAFPSRFFRDDYINLHRLGGPARERRILSEPQPSLKLIKYGKP